MHASKFVWSENLNYDVISFIISMVRWPCPCAPIRYSHIIKRAQGNQTNMAKTNFLVKYGYVQRYMAMHSNFLSVTQEDFVDYGSDWGVKDEHGQWTGSVRGTMEKVGLDDECCVWCHNYVFSYVHAYPRWHNLLPMQCSPWPVIFKVVRLFDKWN